MAAHEGSLNFLVVIVLNICIWVFILNSFYEWRSFSAVVICPDVPCSLPWCGEGKLLGGSSSISHRLSLKFHTALYDILHLDCYITIHLACTATLRYILHQDGEELLSIIVVILKTSAITDSRVFYVMKSVRQLRGSHVIYTLSYRFWWYSTKY